MTCNFDFNANIDSDNADLTPFWEVAETEYIRSTIQEAEIRWWKAICADDYAWEICAETLHAIVREAEEVLAGYGIRPSVEEAYEKYGFIC